MPCPAGHLLPGPKFIPELLPRHPEPFANTCHPLSITKSPVPRCHACPQTQIGCPQTQIGCPQTQIGCPQTQIGCPQLGRPQAQLGCLQTQLGCPQTQLGCPQSATAATSLLPCQPLVQKCLLLYPEPCETTRLLPCPRGSGLLRSSESPRGDRKRVAKSLPPCAPPRCPERGRLRFPPCGIRCSSASCRGQCRSHKVAKTPPSCCPELPGGYSLPLRGVTECPPQRCSFLRGYLGAVDPLRCSKGYPTQELLGCYTSEQRLSSAKGVEERPQGTKECPPLRAVTKGTKECPQLRAVTKGTKECPQLRAVTKGTKECPPLRAVTKGTKECPPLRAVTKSSALLEATKGRSLSAQQLSRSRCPQHPRGPPRPSRLAPAGAKRSGHVKKSRCASKWLW